MNLIYCDNETNQLDSFRDSFANTLAEHSISFCSDPQEIIDRIHNGEQPDAVLLDIELGSETTGLDISERIFSLSPSTQILLVTAYTEKYVQDAFLKNANITAFLTKPITEEYLLNAINKAEKQMQKKTFSFFSKGNITAVDIENVMYLESEGRYVALNLDDGRKLLTAGKLSEIMCDMPDSIILCHKSFAVNMSKIQSINAKSIILNDGKDIPVSRARLADTKKAFLEFLARK